MSSETWILNKALKLILGSAVYLIIASFLIKHSLASLGKRFYLLHRKHFYMVCVSEEELVQEVAELL